LTNRSSFRYTGLVQRKTVGVNPSPDKKGFTVVLKKIKGQRKPAKSYNVIKMRQPGFRRPLKKLRNILTKNSYRKDLTKVSRSSHLEICVVESVLLSFINLISSFHKGLN
jgi:large subunit ribosomal protein L28e